MVGLLLGLAMSPTTTAFVGAIGTLLAVLLGLNDRHFSNSKSLRIGSSAREYFQELSAIDGVDSIVLERL
jgi:hypothetical protein